MKESIKRGITIDLVDISDNFISLIQGDKVEYVKQVTKTSKDNYVTVLMMENKVVTKDILRKHNIKVPKGEEYNNLEEAISEAKSYINKPIVINPKSTNFGIGISIFPEGVSEDDILMAL